MKKGDIIYLSYNINFKITVNELNDLFFIDFITCRTVLWWMVFSGIGINYMLRVQLNLVIVAVVVPPHKISIIGQCNGVIEDNNTWQDDSLIIPDDYQQHHENNSQKVNDKCKIKQL